MATHAANKRGQDSSQKSTKGKKVNNVRLHSGNILLPCVIWMEEKLKHLFIVATNSLLKSVVVNVNDDIVKHF